MTIRQQVRLIESRAYYSASRRDILERLSAGETAGDVAWDLLQCPNIQDDDPLLSLDGWPTCGCSCGCSEPATCTDDAGGPACAECADYTVDDDGDVHCSRMDDVEIVTESCAGSQTRSYVRLKPPTMPEADPNGCWALYWSTAADDAHVVARFATREKAEQAVAAKDWPPPGDHTRYLCGYEVRGGD